MPGKRQARSLVEYERARKKAACAVCSLPEALVAQVRVARSKKIPQAMTLEWLKDEHGITLSRQQFTSHSAAHHDQWSDEWDEADA